MYPRKRIDIEWSDLGTGLLACRRGQRETRRQALQHSVDRLLLSPELRASSLDSPWLATLSVRTGFDLLLSALALPPGSELLVSAITIPHMLDIIAHHGLVAVPVDLDMASLSLDFEALKAALTPKTRGVLVAHLFGSRMPLDPIARFARERGLILIEDAAQAFIGKSYLGHPQADVSLFSFGSIKSFTALGGAMMRIADASLKADIEALCLDYPVQSSRAYAMKLLKHVPLRYVGGSPRRYGVLTALAERFGPGHDALVMGLTRGFPGEEIFSRLRQRPSAALLQTLKRRVERATPAHLEVRRQLGSKLAARLEGRVEVVGRRGAHHTWWLFPVVVPEPDRLRAIMQRAGFDAALGSTSLAWVPPPDRSRPLPEEARRVMSSILYLPLDPAMDDAALDEMSALAIAYVSQHRGPHRAHAATGRGPSTARLAGGDPDDAPALAPHAPADRDSHHA